MLCQKQTPKQIEAMLIALNIIPTIEIDLNIIMEDVIKAQGHREFFPEIFQAQNEGTRVINWERRQMKNRSL